MNNTTATPTNWKELIVTDTEGNTCGTLAQMIHDAPGNIELSEDGAVSVMEDFFISIPGEEPTWEVPTSVDWSGLKEAYAAITGAEQE